MITLTQSEKKAIPFVLPGFILTILLIIYPLLYIISMSFSNNNFGEISFNGLNNYISLFKNPQFIKASINTLKFTFGSVISAFSIGLFLALLLTSKRVKRPGLWRSIIFIAWVIPGVVKATAFKWIYQTDGGILNYVLSCLGLINSNIEWLTNSSVAIWSVVIIQIWSTAPYVMLMMTASLQQISLDVYESAEIDGAGPVLKFFKITLPSVKEMCFINILMLFVWAINEFSLIWITTSGGQNTSTLAILVYNQFKVLNINAASASAVMQLLVTMLFASVYIKIIKEK